MSCRCVQIVPFHSQVSPSPVATGVPPAKSTAVAPRRRGHRSIERTDPYRPPASRSGLSSAKSPHRRRRQLGHFRQTSKSRLARPEFHARIRPSGRSHVRNLSPICAVPFPGAAVDHSAKRRIRAAKQHSPATSWIEGHGMAGTRHWSAVRNLGPIGPIPLPGIAKLRSPKVRRTALSDPGSSRMPSRVRNERSVLRSEPASRCFRPRSRCRPTSAAGRSSRTLRTGRPRRAPNSNAIA